MFDWQARIIRRRPVLAVAVISAVTFALLAGADEDFTTVSRADIRASLEFAARTPALAEENAGLNRYVPRNAAGEWGGSSGTVVGVRRVRGVCGPGWRAFMVRRLGVLVVVLVSATALAAAPAVAQDAEGSDAAASTVRIQARLLASGKMEVGLQLDGDRTWLPRARLFPCRTAEVGSWLFASPYSVPEGESSEEPTTTATEPED